MKYIILEEINMKNNCIVVYNEEKEAVIFDAPDNGMQIIEFLEKNDLTLKAIFLTHHHFDHIFSVDMLYGKYPELKVHISNMALQSMYDRQISLIDHIDGNKAKFDSNIDVTIIKEGQFTFDNWLNMEIIFTPGHTPGDTCFYIADLMCVITGDAMFNGKVLGRTDLPGSNQLTLVEGLKRKILTLPDETFILPGHNYDDMHTIGEAKKFFKY